MPTYSSRAQGALLKAVSIFDAFSEPQADPSQVNRLFDLDGNSDSLEDLANGLTLARILHELDSEFNPSDLETNTGTSKYLTNKRNIQAVYKGLFRFIRRQVPELACQAKTFDYHAVAENPEPQGLSQLLAVMVSAAAMGPDNQKYIPRIQTGLDRETQAEIMQIIRNIQDDIANSKEDEDLDEAIDAVMEARDIDLLVEEQNAALRQQLDTTKKTLSDYITRLEHLQLSHEELKYEKEKNDRELEVLRKATQDGANSAEMIQLLEAQVHEQMEIIAQNEEAIRSHTKIKTQLENDVQRLTQRSIQADELRDQVAEWKHKAEELEKKANTAERYKQKLESQQHLVKEVQNLQYERTELQEQLRSLVADKDRGDRTRTVEAELTKMIAQSEQHLWDERNAKNQLIRDVSALEEELARLRAQRHHDERFIQDLQEQAQHGGDGITTDALGITGSHSLEDELSEAPEDGQGQANPNMVLEISRLKTENSLLRGTMGPTGDAASLRVAYDDLKRQHDRLQKDRDDLFEKYAVGQEQISAIIENEAGEGLVTMINNIQNKGPLQILTTEFYRTQAFINLRKQCAQAVYEKEQLQKSEADLKAQVSDKDRELLEARTKLSAIGKESADAMEELRGTDKIISESLKAEVERLRKELNDVHHERDAQKSQLIEVLLAKDKLLKEAEGRKDKDAPEGVEGLDDADVTEAASKAAEKIEKLRTRLKERTQQLQQSEQDKIDLQKKLKTAQGGDTTPALKAELDQKIKNLERENALMATAWYDLMGRLQSNHVVVQRRPDAPKSWLNKQRQMVNGQLRRRDSLYLY